MAAILSAILVIGCQTKPIFELEREVDGSNPYMKFGRNLIQNDSNHLDIYSMPLIGLRCEKTCLWGFANNKGTDQPAHSRRLISAFVIRFKESIKCKLATSEISIF